MESVLLIVVTLCLHKAIMNLYIKYEDQGESSLSRLWS